MRQAVQMLLFLERGEDVNTISNDMAKKFARMYDGDESPDKTDVELYILAQAKKGDVREAVRFISEKFDAFLKTDRATEHGSQKKAA